MYMYMQRHMWFPCSDRPPNSSPTMKDATPCIGMEGEYIQ